MLPLYVSEDGNAFVWNADDWYELRTKYRICGTLIGSVPTYPRQNDFLGLPMALMSEEAALLVKKGICVLYKLPNLTNPPSEENITEVKELEKRLQVEQSDALKKRKIEQISQKMDIIVAGKRKKMLSKGLSGVLDKESLMQDEISKIPPLLPAYLLVHLPMQHQIETDRLELSIEDLKPTVNEGDGLIKFAIYKDLWEKGHFITDGLKFGCDYLVYPGDPVRFHAMYMVKCIYDEKLLFSSSSLVAFGRLSVAVNKLAVLAFRSISGEVQYQTVQWHDSVNG